MQHNSISLADLCLHSGSISDIHPAFLHGRTNINGRMNHHFAFIHAELKVPSPSLIAWGNADCFGHDKHCIILFNWGEGVGGGCL